jgi:LysR family pca operon transcriptional activator
MSLDPRHLAQLAAIVDTGSFTEAAVQMELTQSALSRNMKTLERRVGAPVLRRGRRGASPTELGAMLARYGDVIRVAGLNAESATTTVGDAAARQLTIAATSLISEFCLVEPMAGFMDRHPALTCHLRVGLIEELVSMVTLGEADLAIGYFGALTGAEALQYEVLLQDWLAVVARPGHPQAGIDDIVALADSDARWILPEPRNRLRWEIEGALRYNGVERVKVAYETGTTSQIVRLLAATDGISMLPRFALSPLLARGELVELCPDRDLLRRPIGLLSQPDRRKSSIVTAFVRALKQIADTYGPANRDK